MKHQTANIERRGGACQGQPARRRLDAPDPGCAGGFAEARAGALPYQHPTLNQQLTTHPLLSLAIRAGAVEIDQDIARFGAFVRADNAAVFQFVHDAGGACVAKA